VGYAVPVDGPGPYTAEVELRYQAIGYREADSSVVVATATAKAEGSPASAF
jgi:hypothetical protein